MQALGLRKFILASSNAFVAWHQDFVWQTHSSNHALQSCGADYEKKSTADAADIDLS